MRFEAEHTRFLRKKWQDQLAASVQSLFKQPLTLFQFAVLRLMGTEQLSLLSEENLGFTKINSKTIELIELVSSAYFGEYKINNTFLKAVMNSGLDRKTTLESITANNKNDFYEACEKLIQEVMHYKCRIRDIKKHIKRKIYRQKSLEVKKITGSCVVIQCSNAINILDSKLKKVKLSWTKSLEFNKFVEFELNEYNLNTINAVGLSLHEKCKRIISIMKPIVHRHHYNVIRLSLYCILLSRDVKKSIFDFTVDVDCNTELEELLNYFTIKID